MDDTTRCCSSKTSILSTLRKTMRSSSRTYLDNTDVPHSGALCRIDVTTMTEDTTTYVLEIAVDGGTHDLNFTRKSFEFMQRLFWILDTESKGRINRETVHEFVTLRCPVFWRRDEDLKRLNLAGSKSDDVCCTFDEIWTSVVLCSKTARLRSDYSLQDTVELGLEGWMVFCRFIALAQYLEGKRRFSARHLQQTMRHRNSPRGSEVVVVDVPPPEPPVPLSPRQLANYENQSMAPLPIPELDLDHNMLAAHDTYRKLGAHHGRGSVKVNLFGSPSSLPSFSSSLLNNNSGAQNLDFALSFTPYHAKDNQDDTIVRRSMSDLKWLDDTFTAHKVLGGNLCGRILPQFPFPSHEESVLNSSIKSTSGAITAVATTGVGRIRDAAKSLLGNYLTAAKTLASEESLHSSKTLSKKSMRSSRSKLDIYCNANSPTARARHVERYLNYLLEHPALSTSFPLNTILKASQSGLEAAKDLIEEVNRASREISEQTPQLDDGKISISSGSPNLSWVRTAAQAAMALKVHGMLETTGMNSASARLQHASLPSFGNAVRPAGWEDDEGRTYMESQTMRSHVATNSSQGRQEAGSFEDGVISVQSELLTIEPSIGDDGFDLLPLPVPAPERRILSAGGDDCTATFVREGRFHYGTSTLQDSKHLDSDDKSSKAFLGDIAVDENIGKLREVIGSVENTLSRCLSSIAGIAKAQQERQCLHLEVVRGLDSWGGMRGKFVSQRFLLKGVSGIEHSREIFDEGDSVMLDDIFWQNSLARSAVSAAEDVRSAVRASRTAANAKAAASAASFAAQNACDTLTFTTIDEARAAQTRASIAHSHSIHAAVVDHETKTVMRRSALALAHDVKCWNGHRKREMLLSCMAYARSQYEGTRRSVDAWSSLRDGFIGTTAIPSTHDRRHMQAGAPLPFQAEARHPAPLDVNEVTATIYASSSSEGNTEERPHIVAVDHNIFGAACLEAFQQLEENDAENTSFTTESHGVEPSSTKGYLPFESTSLLAPFATAAPIPEEDEDNLGISYIVRKDDRTASRSSDHDLDTSTSNDEVLSSSMQSLIDGLMNWGGGTDDDHFTLPAGMAASIALGDQSGFESPKIA